MTRTKTRTDPAFEELVRRDVFGETTEQEQAFLRGPKMAERFLVSLVRVAESTHMQMQNHNNGTQPRGDEWIFHARTIYGRYSARIAEIRSIVKDLMALRAHGDVPALLTEISRLRGAIRAHQAAVEQAELEPEEWDAELWAMLLKPANRTRPPVIPAPGEEG